MTGSGAQGLEALIERLDLGGDLAEFSGWVSGQPGDVESLWKACPAGEWLLWFSAAVGTDARLVVRAGCACVRVALQAGPKVPPTVEGAVRMVESWCRGESTIAQCDDAGYQVYSTQVPGDDGWAAGVADAAVWVASLVSRLPDPESDDEDEAALAARHEYRSSALMSALRAAEALAHAGVPGALVTSSRWLNAFDAARTQCADLVRATIPFEALGTRY